jgi:hypothetical protein
MSLLTDVICSGDLDLVQWAVKSGGKIPLNAPMSAGTVEVLKWLMEVAGCSWDPEKCLMRAVRVGYKWWETVDIDWIQEGERVPVSPLLLRVRKGLLVLSDWVGHFLLVVFHLLC